MGENPQQGVVYFGKNGITLGIFDQIWRKLLKLEASCPCQRLLQNLGQEALKVLLLKLQVCLCLQKAFLLQHQHHSQKLSRQNVGEKVNFDLVIKYSLMSVTS